MIMKDLRAGDVMVRPVVTATKRASARDVALQLLNGLYSGIPIADEQGRVIGMVTEFDLLKAAEAGKNLLETAAEEIMSRDEVITAELDTRVSDLMKIMIDKNIIRVPIMDKGEIVGVVARCDVLKALIEPEFVTYSLGTRNFWRGLVPKATA
jgi:predicted transcriptional regulator